MQRKFVWVRVIGVLLAAGVASKVSALPTLILAPTPESLYVRPGQPVVMRVNVAGLTDPVFACQAMLGYESAFFPDPTGPVVGPGDSPWEAVLWDSWRDGVGQPGAIDAAVGLVLGSGSSGTTADGTVAVVTLTAGSLEGITRFIFRPDVVPDPGLTGTTFLTDMEGDVILPTKVDSQDIVIDGTAPTLSVLAAEQGGDDVLDGAQPVVPGLVVITVAAGDALAGLEGAPVVKVTREAEEITLAPQNGASPFVYHWPVDSSTTKGWWTLEVRATDRAGNSASSTAHRLLIGQPTLALRVTPAPLYVRPGEPVVLRLEVAGLPVPVNACQAMIGFDSTFFPSPTGGVVWAGGGPWDTLIWQTWSVAEGELDTAIGVGALGTVGTMADGTVALIELTAGSQDGSTTVVFRPDADPDPFLIETTFLTDLLGHVILPIKEASQPIIIDGTGPVVSVLAAEQNSQSVLDGLRPVEDGVVNISVAASDALAGLAGAPAVRLRRGGEVVTLTAQNGASPFAYEWTVDAQTTRGRWTLEVEAADALGNTTLNTNHVLLVGPTTLSLVVSPAPLYVRPGDPVVLQMNVTSLPTPVNACQAMLSYDAAFFPHPGGGTVSPGGGPWDLLLWESWVSGSGRLDTAIGVWAQGAVGTVADGTVATITLVAGPQDGVTRVQFRPDASPDPGLVETTYLVDLSGGVILPVKVDSQDIVIDGTGPALDVVAAVQGGESVLDGAKTVLQGTVEITITASDALSGLAAAPSVLLVNGPQVVTLTTSDTTSPFHYQWTVTSSTPNGRWDIVVSATDALGNAGLNDAHHLVLNKNQITGQVELQGFVGTGTVPPHTRAVTFVATGGAATKTWTLWLTNESGSVFDFVLLDVPEGTTGLSAKTSWHLRRKVTVALDAEGQGTASFVGAQWLLGGDLTGDNQVQFLDYLVLQDRWFTFDPAADIDGALGVQFQDYGLLRDNWFTSGDPE